MKLLTTIAMMVLITLSSGCSEGLTGTYSGVFNGATVECCIVQSGDQLTGVLSDGNSSFNFKGTIENNLSVGTMVSNDNIQLLYTANFNGNSCTFQIRQMTGNNNPFIVTLSKAGNQASGAYSDETTQGGELDQGVVGRWKEETSASTSGSAAYASFTSVKYYQFNADGTYSVTDGGAAGGGEGWSYVSSAGGGGRTGTWYTKEGYMYTEQNGKSYYNKYTLYEGKLVFGTKGNYSFLYPIN